MRFDTILRSGTRGPPMIWIFGLPSIPKMPNDWSPPYKRLDSPHLTFMQIFFSMKKTSSEWGFLQCVLRLFHLFRALILRLAMQNASWIPSMKFKFPSSALNT